MFSFCKCLVWFLLWKPMIHFQMSWMISGFDLQTNQLRLLQLAFEAMVTFLDWTTLWHGGVIVTFLQPNRTNSFRPEQRWLLDQTWHSSKLYSSPLQEILIPCLNEYKDLRELLTGRRFKWTWISCNWLITKKKPTVGVNSLSCGICRCNSLRPTLVVCKKKSE